MTSTVLVRAQIDKSLKDEATTVLAEFGLTVSDIVRMTLTRVVNDRAVPLELKVPNEQTRAAIKEARRLMRKRNTQNPSGLFE